MNAFLLELCDWLSADRLGKKVLFVRNMAVGNQLLRMAANHGVPAVNVVAVPVRTYMNQMAEGELVARGLQKIDAVTASIALQRIMGELGEGQFTTMGQVELTTASRMLPQLEELEQNGIVPSDLERVGQFLLAKVWDAFLVWKKENRYVSEAEVSSFASVPSDVSFAVLSDLPLSKMEQEFVSGIPAERLTVIHLTVPSGMEPPRNAVFSGGVGSGVGGSVGVGDAAGSVLQGADVFSAVSCVVCQDIGTEIRAAFQYLIEHHIPGETAAIVCPDEVYGMRVAEEGKLLGIRVDSAFGIPASMTGGALLVRCMLEFASSDYDAEALTPALISGTMAVYDEHKKMLLFGQRMLRTFREEKVGWDRERWEALCADPDEKHALAALSVYGWVQFFERAPRPVRDVATELTALILGSLRRGAEYELYLRIVDEVSRIYQGNMTGREFLEIVQEISEGMRVDAHPTDTPGKVYCCSYENAMFVDRSIFLMLGMSWDAFNRLGSEFPLLHDNEKKDLCGSGPCRLRLAGDRAHDRQYAVRELLENRRDASAVFSRARMNYIGGEGIMAAGLFSDAAAVRCVETDEVSGKPVVRVPQVNILDRRALTESDVRMRSGYEPRVAEFEMDEGRKELWKEEFNRRVWSATTMEVGAACPRSFVFKIQLGVNDEKPAGLERFSTAWLDSTTRGNLVHEVLEQYFRAVRPRKDFVDEELLGRLIDERVAVYRKDAPIPKNIRDIGPEVEKVRKITRQVIRKHVIDPGRETLYTELEFGEDEPVYLEFGPFRIRVKGKIDRVDKVKDGYEIIDYKTGKPYWFKKDFETKLQYYLYTLAWETMHPDMPVVRASYELLDGPGGAESKTVEMTDEVRGVMYERVSELLQMLSDPETAVTPVFLMQNADGEQRQCSKYCKYTNLCKGAVGQMLGAMIEEEPVEDEEE